MPVAAANKTTPAPPQRRISLELILDQLDEDFGLLRQVQADGTNTADEVEEGLAYYFHACIRPALHWFQGDPYRAKFPPEYQKERLPKACAYLANLQGADELTVRQAREKYIARLRNVWPDYAATCTTLYDGNDGISHSRGQIQGWKWEGLDTAWAAEAEKPSIEEEKRTHFLPKFLEPLSEEFHLCCIVVLYLNRQTKLRLADLSPYGWADQAPWEGSSQ